MTDYRSFVIDQQELRSKLAHVMGSQAFSFQKLADAVGLPVGSIFNFLKGTRKTQMKTLYKINEYVKQAEINNQK